MRMSDEKRGERTCTTKPTRCAVRFDDSSTHAYAVRVRQPPGLCVRLVSIQSEACATLSPPPLPVTATTITPRRSAHAQGEPRVRFRAHTPCLVGKTGGSNIRMAEDVSCSSS